MFSLNDPIFYSIASGLAWKEPFAKYWIHNGLITINGQKMSKSLGNSMTIKQALDKYTPDVIRYAMLEKHYSTEIDLNDAVFSLAEKQLYYFYNTLAKINAYTSANNQSNGNVIDPQFIEDVEKNLHTSMDDDFSTAAAIAYIFSICKYVNTLLNSKQYTKQDISVTLTQLHEKIREQYSIIGLLQQSPEAFIEELKNKHLLQLGITADYIEDLILQRKDAKAGKNYKLADQIRTELSEQGIILNDNKDGASWDIKALYSIDAE